MKKTNLFMGLLMVLILVFAAGCGKDVEDAEPLVAEEIETEDMPEDEIVDVEQDLAEPEEAPEEDTTEEMPEEEIEDEVTDDAEGDAEDEGETSGAELYKVISLKDLNVYPEELFIKVGTTVEWRNVNDNFNHIIGWSGQTQAGVRPEAITPGNSWNHTFTEPGVIKWFSTARPTIQGVITVEE